MSFGIGYGADEYAKQSGAVLVFKSEVGGSEISFAAFLTDFSQNFTSEWASERVFGRNDPIATFQGTKRTISLAWDIPSATLADAQGNLKKCGDLIQFLYPGYTTLGKSMPKKPKGNKNTSAEEKKQFDKQVKKIAKHNARMPTIMSKAPLIRITYANLISGNVLSKPPSKKKKEADAEKQAGQEKKDNAPQANGDGVGDSTLKNKDTKATAAALSTSGLLGYVDSLSWKPILDMGSFSDGGKLYPKVIALNLNFNVLHEEFLGWKGRSWMGGKFPFKIN